jgi:U6 snRNA phosphodiesterase
VPDLYAVDADYVLSELCKDEHKLEKVLLSREFHVSLGRPVAVQVHQIDSFYCNASPQVPATTTVSHL